jgi:hypothetical protein
MIRSRMKKVKMKKHGIRLRMKKSLVRRLKRGWAFSKMIVTFHVYLAHVPLTDMDLLSLRASDRRYKRYLSGEQEMIDQHPEVPSVAYDFI